MASSTTAFATASAPPLTSSWESQLRVSSRPLNVTRRTAPAPTRRVVKVRPSSKRRLIAACRGGTTSHWPEVGATSYRP